MTAETASFFFHPAAFFAVGAAGAALLPRGIHRWLLPAMAVLAFLVMVAISQGEGGANLHLYWLGLDLNLARVDRLSIIFAHIFALQAILGCIYAMHLKDRWQHVASMGYMGGAFLCVFAGDYLTLFIGWELMSVASTLLIWFRRRRESTAAGFRYFLVHTLGGLALLAGIMLRYQATGNFDFNPVDPTALQLYDWLILLGFAVNAAVVPLHAWLPDAYPEATVTGAVFMSAFTTKTAVYVLARAFAGVEILGILGVVMCLWGVFYATMENNARRILSYHIVSQVGYMVAGIGIGTAMTVNGACAHAYAHILYKGLLFMGAGCLLHAAGTANLNQLGGLARRLPLVFLLYMAAAVSISGMPFFNGFISKTMTIAGAAESHHTWLALGMEIAAVGTFLSVGIKLPYFAFFAKPDSEMHLEPIPVNMYVAMLGGALLCLVTGLFPNLLYSLLPFPMHGHVEAYTPFVTALHHVEFHPYELFNILQAFTLLGFTGLGFYLLRNVLTPHAQRNMDFEWFYVLIGKAFYLLVSRPAAWIDGIWSEVYRTLGLPGLKLGAKGASAFDVAAIDGVVDGSAKAVGATGRLAARLQTGDLQHYAALATALALGIAACLWWLG